MFEVEYLDKMEILAELENGKTVTCFVSYKRCWHTIHIRVCLVMDKPIQSVSAKSTDLQIYTRIGIRTPLNSPILSPPGKTM